MKLKMLGLLQRIFCEEPQRTRGTKGRFIADDKSTEDYNEAWVGGKAPRKKKKTSKNQNK